MDKWQEKLDEELHGDINEKIEKEVSSRYWAKVKHENNGVAYNHEQTDKIIAQLRQTVRQEILDNMEFKRRYEEEKHLNDLQEQQRNYDSDKYHYTKDHMADRNWNERMAMHTEEHIYTKDIDNIDPNTIVDNYKDLADFFNIHDTQMMGKIIKEAQNRDINEVELRGLIENEEGKKMIEMIMKENNGDLNIDQLMDNISQLIDNNIDSRIKTSQGYMDVAKKDLDARASGIERKVDTLNKTTLSSVERDKAYLETINNAYTQGMDSAKRNADEIRKRISLSEVEKATEGVRTSSINDNIHLIRQQNQQAKDDIEKE